MQTTKADRAQLAIDFDRCARDRIGELLGDAIEALDLIAPNDDGRRLTSPATAAAVFRELAGMIGAKDHFRVKAETLAGRMQRHRSAIVRALKALRDVGLILHTRTGRSSLYSLDWSAARDLIEQAAKRRQAEADADTAQTADEPAIVDSEAASEAEAVELPVSASAVCAPTDGAPCAIDNTLPLYPKKLPTPPTNGRGRAGGRSFLD